MYNYLKFIYDGAKTKRFHTRDMLTSQNVGEHSFGVAMLVYLMEPQARKEVLLSALTHDLAEHQIGDISSPVKRANPMLAEMLQVMETKLLDNLGLEFESVLTPSEAALVKAADMLDGLMFCVRERRMGGRGEVSAIYKRYTSYFDEQLHLLPARAAVLLDAVKELWEESNER